MACWSRSGPKTASCRRTTASTTTASSRHPGRMRSRRLLVRDLLQCPSAAEAVTQATRELDTGRYAGCNVVCGDAERLVVLQAGDWLRVRPLPVGLHVLTSHDVNDASDPRLGHALWWLSQRSYACAEECLLALKELCAQTGNGGPPMCLHGERSGTVSSSIVALRSPLAQSR